MDQTGILLDEILIDIFGYLSPKTIKNCSLVCRRWNEIISSSKGIMERFMMTLTSPGSCEAAKEVKRKHYTIITDYFDEDFLDLTRFHNLSKLKIYNYQHTEYKLSNLIIALNNLPLLKSFETFADFIDDTQDMKDVPKVRLNLKELLCLLEIFHIFDCDTLKELCLFRSRCTENNRKTLPSFINRQKGLKKLEVVHILDLFEEFDSLTCQFQLETIKIVDSFEQHEGLIKFLNIHKNSLDVLKLEKNDVYTFTSIAVIQKFVLRSMPNIKELTLSIPIDINELPNANYVSRNLQKLSFYSINSSLEESKQIIELFPNVKKLNFSAFRFDSHHAAFLHHMSITNLNLESLRTNVFFNTTDPIPHFKKLKILTVNNFETENFNAFINRHLDTLEEINIKYTSGFKESTVTSINNCKNLKKINIKISGQEEQDKMIKLLAGSLLPCKPIQIMLYKWNFKYLKTTFKLPEDNIFLGLKNKQNFEDQIMQYWTKIYNFFDFLFSD